MAVAVTASAIGHLALTLLADVTGSFTLVATVATTVPLGVITLTLAAPLPAGRERQRLDAHRPAPTHHPTIGPAELAWIRSRRRRLEATGSEPTSRHDSPVT